MRISFLEHIVLLFKAFLTAFRYPLATRIKTLLCPIESTRYLEFSYILKYLKSNRIHKKIALDVSSPAMLDYLIEPHFDTIVKCNIDADESGYFSSNSKIAFTRQNGTQLGFQNNCYDAVLSVSVIEHIHEHYLDAINEMLRVLSPGGVLYITYPVASQHLEEWLEKDIYSDQHKSDDRVFFQYRYGEEAHEEILSHASSQADIVYSDIYWERINGLYDWLTAMLRFDLRFRLLNILKLGFLNLLTGPLFFNSKPGTFESSKAFGNAHLIMIKRKDDE